MPLSYRTPHARRSSCAYSQHDGIAARDCLLTVGLLVAIARAISAALILALAIHTIHTTIAIATTNRLRVALLLLLMLLVAKELAITMTAGTIATELLLPFLIL